MGLLRKLVGWLDLPSPPASRSGLLHGILGFLEQPLVTAPMGILGGLLGLMFPWMMYVCGISIILAVHRFIDFAGRPRWQRIATLIVLPMFLAVGIFRMNEAVQEKLKASNLSFAQLVVSLLPKNIPAQLPQPEQHLPTVTLKIPALSITPERVEFPDLPPQIPNQQYIFTLKNQSSKDIYLAEFDFVLHVPDPIPPHTYDLGIEVDSPDAVALRCQDKNHNPIYVISISHLGPGETKKALLTYKGPAGPTLVAETGFHTTEPSPVSLSRRPNGGLDIARKFRFSNPKIAQGSCGIVIGTMEGR